MEDLVGPTIIKMAEDVIMSGIEKLRRSLVDDRSIVDTHVKQLKEELMNEMEILARFVKDKKLEDRCSMLRHLIFNVLQKEAYHQLKLKNLEDKFRKTLQEISTQLCKLGDFGNDGVGEVVVGLEEDVKCFLDEINSMPPDQSEPFVAQINGFAGSGKTTLARQLFNHAQVVDNYDSRAWVNCEDILCTRDLLLCLIGQFGDDDYEDVEIMENIHLVMKLHQQLQGERFFIVLDNVFAKSEEFVDLLPDAAERRSMLLLITRDSNYMGFRDYWHQMKPLDLDKSWELLLKKMPPDNNKFPKHVVRKAKTILLKHSGGLPLAIKEVAMEWAEMRRTGAEWEDVVESEALELRVSLEALESTVYNRLNPHIKLLFLHLGFFKLGTIIRVQRLLLTLAASGVLGEENCYECLETMIYDENFIDIKRNPYYWKGKNVYINGIFHKLAIMKLRKCDEGTSYLTIYCSRKRFNCSTDQNEKILCVSFNGGGCFDASPSYWTSFNQLRVLDFEGFGLKFLPETIGELIELRYLGLRNNYIEELPHSLGNLKNLEVLDIAFNFMVKVPDIIYEMDALVHLFMSDIVCTAPLKIEALQKLETLTYISVDNWAYEVSGLQMMTSLSLLGMEGLNENSNVSKLFASLAVLENLDRLVLRGLRFRSMPLLDELSFLHGVEELKLDGLITMLPSAEKFPPNLTSLTLVNSCLDDDPMPILEKLESLEYLRLQNTYIGPQMVISENGFSTLSKMCIGEFWQLRNIQVGQGALGSLEKLEIYSCPYLHNLPNISIKDEDIPPEYEFLHLFLN